LRSNIIRITIFTVIRTCFEKVHLSKLAIDQSNNMTTIIYKILTESQWKEFQQNNEFKGAPIDIQDGYIHCSYKEQVEGTLQKHFSQIKEELFLSEVDASNLNLKVENGFPHIYEDSLLMKNIIKTTKINL
jgi:uncharacterized protein (DUF952 family)